MCIFSLKMMNQMKYFFRPIYILGILIIISACGPIATPMENSMDNLEIVYAREGGLAGLSQEWIIHPDGRIEGPNGEELQADPQDVFAIYGLAGGMAFFELTDDYMPSDDCCDTFTYTLTVVVGGQKKTVRTSDTGNHPEQLSQVLTAIDDLIRSAEPVN